MDGLHTFCILNLLNMIKFLGSLNSHQLLKTVAAEDRQVPDIRGTEVSRDFTIR